MSMNINEFREKFTKEQLEKIIQCKTMKEAFAYAKSQNIQINEDDENILASMLGETKDRPEGAFSSEPAEFISRFKVFTDTCDGYEKRTYVSDSVWETGYDPRTGPREEKDPICMNCAKARVKNFYCFCLK